ncbi:hypothetical protein ACSFA0_22550 [Variovorax sp. LT1P1]|uniref:hypothetical protein n=1 Tax=Variovorax sp. LT1P1 TaxID=3443730 RepID=UPI003F449069
MPPLPGDGSGEIAGDSLVVRWGRSVEEPFLACEVIELVTGCVWEVGIADAGYGAPLTFWRRVAGAADAPPLSWHTAVSSAHPIEEHVPRVEPTFLSLLQVLGSPKALAVLGGASNGRALQEEETRYWRDLARSQARAHRAERAAIKARLQAVRTPSGGEPPGKESQPERNWQYSDLEEWAAVNSDRIVVLPRALAGGKKADYHQPAHVFGGLEILADAYPALRSNAITNDEFKKRCDEFGLDLSRSVDRSIAGSAGDEYFVRWKGRRVFLGHHLRRGTSREPRFSLRIYFAWDEEDEVVIVGWLPSHLTASMS